MIKHKKFKIAAIFDTETTNIGEGAETRAYPILYIFNDLRNTSLESYTSDTDDVRFYRHTSEALTYIDDLIEYGRAHDYVPIIAAYNLMFDMQTLMLELAQSYAIKANAQTATSVYTLDLCVGDNVVCRFGTRSISKWADCARWAKHAASRKRWAIGITRLCARLKRR